MLVTLWCGHLQLLLMKNYVPVIPCSLPSSPPSCSLTFHLYLTPIQTLAHPSFFSSSTSHFLPFLSLSCWLFISGSLNFSRDDLAGIPISFKGKQPGDTEQKSDMWQTKYERVCVSAVVLQHDNEVFLNWNRLTFEKATRWFQAIWQIVNTITIKQAGTERGTNLSREPTLLCFLLFRKSIVDLEKPAAVQQNCQMGQIHFLSFYTSCI